MNQKVKEKWVTKLRSGEYQQGTGFLKVKDSEGVAQYCCLGVLGDIYAKEHNEEWTEKVNGVCAIKTYTTHLPEEVQNWAELDRANPLMNVENLKELCGTESFITDLNDIERLSFEEIATLIENQL